MTRSGLAELFRARSLGTRFLLIVLLGVLLPLALVGVWLTRSTQRAGTTLLRTQLDSAANIVENTVTERWALRDGELELLANNSAARVLLTNGRLSAADSVYLRDLAMAVAPSIQSISYADVTGVSRWRYTPPVPADDPTASRTAVQALDMPVQGLHIVRAILSSHQPLGSVSAVVLVNSLWPSTASALLVPGAAMMLSGSDGPLWTSTTAVNLADNALPAGWEVVRRAPTQPPLRIVLAAPSDSYVKPFERATRAGLGVLATVALVALLLSVVLTSRVTRSLDQLSKAAGAVAAGNLELTLPTTTNPDVGALASAFNDMTQSLRTTLAELAQQRALAAVGEFAAELSHEVRNALTAIRVDLQHAGWVVPRDDAGGPLIARALDSLRQLDATVTSALRLARSGQVTMAPVDLGVVLERAIRTTEPSFRERQATVAPLRAFAPLHVMGDESALQQLFVNLMLNASQAMSASGCAQVLVERRDGFVTIEIHDDGGGISVDELAALGQPFRTSKPDGTGLGLPIAKRIAEAHRGTLTVSSVTGVGTVARVHLPVANVG